MGNLTFKCAGRALITWPYKAGGRSRRGSPKAGTTVPSTDVHYRLVEFYSLSRIN